MTSRCRWAALATILCLLSINVKAQTNLSIYTDHLVNGFQDWSWASHDLANTSPVHSGSDSISVSDAAWTGVSFYQAGFDSYQGGFDLSGYTNLSFWANGGTTGGQVLQFYVNYGATNSDAYVMTALPANSWTQYVLPLTTLGVAQVTNAFRFNFQLTPYGSSTTNTFYLDDIQFSSANSPGLVHVRLNANQTVRMADSRWLGLNSAIWDPYYDTPQTVGLLQEMGTKIMRGPGGSLSDDYNWLTDTSSTNTWTWVTAFPNYVRVATNAGVQTIITVNYGDGTPAQAAAWVAYANAKPNIYGTTNDVNLGVDSNGKDWKTAGYWAMLRAAAPLGSDDGKNFLRLARTAPLGLKYWETGNECYGSWENDTNNLPHDAYTYAVRAQQYMQLMRAVDPTIKIGVVAAPGEDSYANYNTHPATNSATGQVHYGWTAVMLSTLKSLGAAPDFLINHRYPEYTASGSGNVADSDALLLQCSTAWAGDAADLRSQISNYYGAGGSGIELLATENNNDAGAGGKQSTSLVNGLYYADSLAKITQTEFNSFMWWDFRNGPDTNGSFDPTLYGWRTVGDGGMVVNLSDRYPVFYAAKLMQHFAQGGDAIVSTGSDFSLLSAYGSRHADGSVSLLVINKDLATSLNSQVSLSGFIPGTNATLYSYGIPQDTAAETGIGSPDVLQTNTAIAGATFNHSFPPYSLTLLTIEPVAPAIAVMPLAGGQFVLQVQGQSEVRYVLQSSTDLASWNAVATNTLSGTTWLVTNSVAVPKQFWRAVWVP